MQIHLLSGFLGSGKTTAIASACTVLKASGKLVGVVTNDQGNALVDTQYFQHASIASRQVVNGCFCCKYPVLDEQLRSLVENEHCEIIFAESVGSCTDIIATVMKPLQLQYPNLQVTITTVADTRLMHMLFVQKQPLFEDAVKYIYEKQLEEAGLILLTRADLSEEKISEEVIDFVRHHFPGKRCLLVDAANQNDIHNWLHQLDTTAIVHSLASIDYEKYGAGEAMLAWLDRELVISSPYQNAIHAAWQLCKAIHEKMVADKLAIGHLKFLLNDEQKLSFTNTGKAMMTALIPAASAKLLINARIQTSPERLQQITDECCITISREYNCKVMVLSSASFTPGYPTPVYRIAG